jgi:hypothetical protein
VQHLRDARAHAHALAGGEDDDQQGLVGHVGCPGDTSCCSRSSAPAHHATCVPAVLQKTQVPEHIAQRHRAHGLMRR